jgi:hypothetical protein
MPSYPVTIRGVHYPSHAAAARALGLPIGALWYAAERGTLQRAGLGRNSWSKKKVWIDGVEYPTQVAAAKALGMRKESFNARVYNAKKRGETEFKCKEKLVKFQLENDLIVQEREARQTARQTQKGQQHAAE